MINEAVRSIEAVYSYWLIRERPKVRPALIGGENKMLVWNDINADEKIRTYDKGLEIPSAQAVREFAGCYFSGLRVVWMLEATIKQQERSVSL